MSSTSQEEAKEKVSPDSSGLKTRTSLALRLAVSAGLHLAVGAAGVAAVNRRDSREAQALVDHQREIDQQRQGVRNAAVRKAEQEIIHNSLDFWDFVRTVSMVEAEAANLSPLDRAMLDRDFQAVVQRLHERWQDRPITSQEDVRQLIEALRYAFTGYHYYKGMATVSPTSFMRNYGGPCGGLSGTTLAALATTSLRDSIGMRMYMAGDHGESTHLAPTLTFHDREGVEHEVDLTAAGPAFPAGSRLTLNELVESYACVHSIPTLNHSLQLTGPTVTMQGNDHGLAFLFPLPQDRRPFPNGAVPFYSSEIFGVYATNEHGDVILRNPPNVNNDATPATVSDRNYDRERDILRVIRSLYPRQTSQDRHDLQAGETDFVPEAGFSDADWGRLSDAIEKAESSLTEENIAPTEYLKRLGFVIGVYEVAERRAAIGNLVDPMKLAQERLRYYHSQVDRWFANNDSHIETNSALRQMIESLNVQYAIIMLGQRGIDMLFHFYDTELREHPDSRTGKDILVTLIVADNTRMEALRRANALPIYDQFEFIQNMRNFSFGDDNIGERGPILAGNDPFSVNYRNLHQLFGNMADRVFGGLPGEESLPPGTESFRSMNQLINEVHVYGQAHQYDQAWEVQVIAYGIERAAGQVVLNFTHEVDRSVLKETFTPFFHEALAWLGNHPEVDAHQTTHMMRRFLEH